MNRRTLVLAIGGLVIAAFVVGAYMHSRNTQQRVAPAVSTSQSSTLVRAHSPVIGNKDAPVTIVEFFDPACETCRAMYPIVKNIMADHGDRLRLVIRYAPFHKGSDDAVRILEMARKQGIYVKVLEAMLEAQPEWADHHRPDISKAWTAAASAGLDVTAARSGMMAADVTAVLEQDMADIRALGVRQTPTFFVNGKPLPSFGVRQLQDLVRGEADAARKK
jgi:protein-disulfide isomerase